MTLKIKDPVQPQFANVLLYGPPKTGKSAAAASTGTKTLYLNADVGNALFYARQLAGDALDEAEFEGLQTLIDIYDVATKPDCPWETIVVDPISDVHRTLLEERSNLAVRPSLNQRGDVSVELERWCRNMCKYGQTNFIVIAHELVIEPEGGDVQYRPFTGVNKPTLGNKLAGMVDVIGYTGVLEAENKTHFVAQLREARGRVAGDRFNCIANEQGWAELNLAEWFALIGAAKAAASPSDSETDNKTAATAEKE